MHETGGASGTRADAVTRHRAPDARLWGEDDSWGPRAEQMGERRGSVFGDGNAGRGRPLAGCWVPGAVLGRAGLL